MQELLDAIADPTRRRILGLVWEEEHLAGDIAAHFPVTRPAISKHLRVLREAGLISDRRLGTRRLYRARPERVRELRLLLENFWEQALQDVKSVAEERRRDREPDHTRRR